MSVLWFGLQYWKCFFSVSSRHFQCYTRSAVDNTYGNKVMKLSLEKIAVLVRMCEHLLGLPAWLAEFELPQAGGSEGSLLVLCPFTTLLSVWFPGACCQHHTSQEFRACLAQSSYFCSLLAKREMPNFWKPNTEM